MPQFTPETAKVARAKSGSTKRAALKLQKFLAKIGIEKEYIDAFLRGLSSPVVAGVTMYLLLMALERLTNAVYSVNKTQQQTAAQNTIQQLIQSISSGLPPVLGNVFGFGASLTTASASGNPFALDFVALKAAVIIYITTGGNLAGLVGTATNLFSAFTKSA